MIMEKEILIGVSKSCKKISLEKEKSRNSKKKIKNGIIFFKKKIFCFFHVNKFLRHRLILTLILFAGWIVEWVMVSQT